MHVMVVAIGMLVSYLFYQDHLRLRKENIKLVEASVRVDMVALPDKTLQELKSLEQLQRSVPAKKIEVQKTQAPKLKPVVAEDSKEGFIDKNKAPKKSLSDMLKQYSKKDVKQVKRKKQKVVKKEEELLDKKDLSKLSDLVKKGNMVKAGVGLTGANDDVILTKLEEYSAGLPEIVRPYWKLPSYLIEEDLRCRIRIYLKKDGTLIRKSIFKSSGDAEYDQRALSAVEQVGKFPPVPEDVQGKAASGAIILAFPL